MFTSRIYTGYCLCSFWFTSWDFPPSPPFFNAKSWAFSCNKNIFQKRDLNGCLVFVIRMPQIVCISNSNCVGQGCMASLKSRAVLENEVGLAPLGPIEGTLRGLAVYLEQSTSWPGCWRSKDCHVQCYYMFPALSEEQNELSLSGSGRECCPQHPCPRERHTCPFHGSCTSFRTIMTTLTSISPQTCHILRNRNKATLPPFVF